MKNILITGGAGFIGSSLALALISRGYSVTVLDNLLPQVHGEDPNRDSYLWNRIKDKVRFLSGDVTSLADCREALRNQDAVIHLAAETGTGQSMYRISRYAAVNVSGTANLLDCLVNEKHSVKKFLVASSRAVYGEGKYQHPTLGPVYPGSRSPEAMTAGDFEVRYEDGEILRPLPTDENSKLNPASVYGVTKQTQEQMVMSVCQSVDIDAVALRYQNVYGAGQSLLNPYTGILSVFSNQMLQGKPVEVFEDGVESRDFIYIDDAVRATILALENSKVKNNILNVGSGIATSVMDIAQNLRKSYNADVPIKISGRFRLGDIRHNFAEMTHTQSTLGFSAEVSLEEGLNRFCSWVLKQKFKDNRLEQSVEEMKARKLLF